MPTNSFDSFITESSRRYNVPESWIRAVIQIESSWNPNAYRAEPRIADASYGLMQLLYGTARGLGYQGPSTGLYDPATNIDLGTKYLAQLKARYGTVERVISAYNSGRPDLYLTSVQVGNHVRKFLSAMGPVPGGAGTIALILLGWFLFKKG